jgi:hypothetical protein
METWETIMLFWLVLRFLIFQSQKRSAWTFLRPILCVILFSLQKLGRLGMQLTTFTIQPGMRDMRLGIEFFDWLTCGLTCGSALDLAPPTFWSRRGGRAPQQNINPQVLSKSRIESK